MFASITADLASSHIDNRYIFEPLFGLEYVSTSPTALSVYQLEVSRTGTGSPEHLECYTVPFILHNNTDLCANFFEATYSVAGHAVTGR